MLAISSWEFEPSFNSTHRSVRRWAAAALFLAGWICLAQQSALDRGLASLRGGRPDDAIAPLLQAAADPALAPEARYLLGAAYFQSGQYAKVAEQLTGLEHGLHAEHVLFLLEESARLTGANAKARQAFRDLNQRFPDSSWLHFLMGAAYESQADNEHAITEYRSALAKDPRLPNANFAIGYIYWKDRSFEESRSWLTRELEIQPCHSLAAYYLGDTAQNLGDRQRALDLYRRAVDCSKGNQKAHLSLGILLADSSRNEEAIAELRTAAALNVHDPAPHYRLALLFKKLGRKSEAAAEYNRVQEINDAGRKQAEDSLKARP